MSGPISEPRRQYAALPCKMESDGLQVMLITSRQTRRWVLPKGWPKDRLSGAETAAMEAFEEAGLKGSVLAWPIGSYRYAKRLDDGSAVDCIVDVFPLCVGEALDDWPERAQRQRRWYSPIEAANLVDEVGLTALLLQLAQPGASSPC